MPTKEKKNVLGIIKTRSLWFQKEECEAIPPVNSVGLFISFWVQAYLFAVYTLARLAKYLTLTINGTH